MELNKFIANIVYESLSKNELWFHGTDEIFEVPKFINSGREIGFHLGNYEQALNIKNKIRNNYPTYINKYKVNNLRPLRIKDLKFWIPEYIAEELINNGFEVEKSGKGILGSKFYKPEDILNALNNDGYDSLIYKNEYEGDGDSLIVFHDSQLIFVGREEISPIY